MQRIFILLFIFSGFAYANNKDIDLFIGPDDCTECHEHEATIWQHSKHATSFKEMVRAKEAREMAKALGVRRIKTAKECSSCHFTNVDNNNIVRAVAGVSCESCHGGAKHWLKIHDDYGGKTITRDKESKEHKESRMANARQAGLNYPSEPYKIYANCYGCHVISDPDLINKTSHPDGSDFDLVSYSSGEIRHNVFFNKGKENPYESLDTQRLKYIVGLAFDIEYSLKAQESSAGTKYQQSLDARISKNRKKLQQANELLNSETLKAIDNAITNNDIKAIDSNIQKFINEAKSLPLTKLDNLLPKAKDFKGKAYELRK